MYNIIKVLIYLGISLSVWMVVGPWIIEFFNNESRRMKLKTRIKGKRRLRNIKIDIQRLDKIKIMIEVAHSNKISMVGYFFFIISIFTATLLFMIVTNSFSVSNMFLSAVVSLLPFGITYAMFSLKRVNISYEGERLVSEFINQYRVSSGNVKEAIVNTIDSLYDQPNSKRALTKLSFNVNNARNDEETEKAIEEFNYTLNTQWGQLLSHSMLVGLTTGLDITASLDDILKEIKYIKGVIEKGNRDNNESAVLILLFGPGTFILTTMYSLNTLNMSFGQYIHKQIGTPMGLRMLMLIITAQVISVILLLMFRKPKFD